MDRKAAESILRERNMPTFKKLGFMEPPFFKIKMAYVPKDRIVTETVVGMFDSELRNEQGVYIELTDGENLPLNETPTLYYLPYRADYKNVYVKHSDKPGVDRWLVHLDYLQLVDVPDTASKMELPQPSETDEYEDCHFSELTARDRACIELRVPRSNKEWLNDLIRQSTSK